MLRALTFPIKALYAVSFAIVMMVLKTAIGITIIGAIVSALFYWKG